MASSMCQFVLVLCSSAGGKTIAVETFNTITTPVAQAIDVDDARLEGTDPILRLTRRMKLWSIHNTLWHSQVWGYVNGKRREMKRLDVDAQIVVFDHTGWFVEDFASWGEVFKVYEVIPDSIQARARRFLQRRPKTTGMPASDSPTDGAPSMKLHDLPSVERMLKAQDEARASLIRRIPKSVTVTRVDQSLLWANPVKALGPTACKNEATMEGRTDPTGQLSVSRVTKTTPLSVEFGPDGRPKAR